MKNEINKLLDAKVICSNYSSCYALIIIVPKGDSGNNVTQKFIWPMPKFEDIFPKLNSSQYFSALNW